MKHLNRRKFLVNAAKGVAGAMVVSQLPNQLPTAANAVNPIGFQTFPIRQMIEKDFAGALKMMAAMGYRSVEMCSPQGYATMGFAPLAKMKPSGIRSIITDAGLNCPSCHFGSPELFDKLDASIEFSQQLGLSQMICSTFWLPKTATISDYEAAADKLNKAAEKIKSAGMQAGFHNHEFEFKQLDGQLIYDALMNRFDPDLVKMQFQTQVVTLGYRASDYFKKYPGRFISAHLSDWTADNKQVPVGHGGN